MKKDFLEQYSQAKKTTEQAIATLDELTEQVEATKEDLREKLEKALSGTRETSRFDASQLKAFIDKPYVEIPKKENEWYVVAPKFLNFQITKGKNGKDVKGVVGYSLENSSDPHMLLWELYVSRYEFALEVY